MYLILKKTKVKGRTELPNEICTHTRPPDQLRLGPLCATSGNTGPSARQTPEPLARALTMPLHCGMGTRSLPCTSGELGTASVLVLPQPKPSAQFTILLAWVGFQVT